MNKIASRITAAVMAVGMALSLTSCGKKEVYASKDNIYSSQKVELPGGLDYINRMLYANEKFYIVGDKSQETKTENGEAIYTSETLLQVVDLNGTLVKEAVLVSNDGSSNSSRYINNLAMDNDGNLIALENSYEWNETTGESKEGYFVKKFSTEGELISELDLEKFKEQAMKETGQDWFYPENFTFANDGTMLISSNSMIFGVDDNGGMKYVIKNEAANENSWMSGMYKAGDGRIFTMFSTGQEIDGEYISESKLYEIDYANQKLGAEYVYEMNGQIMAGTDEYDLLITRDSGLVGYDVETGESEVIIDWLKSGIDTTAMDSNGTTVLPDGRILCLTYDYDYSGGGYSWSTDDLVINILTKVDPSEIPDKKLVKIYALYLDVGVKRQIVEFNKTNELYKIELTSYDDYATKSYDEALKRMNNDMISGNIPDIIVLNNELPVDSYISKGLLADLYQFMDKDETINKEDYLTNIFDAYSVDGKLYELVPSFNITTLVGKSSVVGEEPGWTMDEFIALADANPEAMVFGYEMTRDNVFMTLISNCYESYIDTATGECHFNSDDFIKVLEFASRFPKEIDWDTLYEDNNYWVEQETRFRDNKALVSDQYMSNFRAIREMEMGTFGEKITFKGYPGAKGNGAAISANTSIAITSKAANPDGAWEFIKYFLSDEYQNDFEWQYPIKISALEAQMAKAKEKPFWVDENGENQYYDNTMYFGGQEVKIGENTDEDNQRVLDLIKSTTNVSRYDRDIYKIIEEEAAPYFEGQKTAKEVADIIQNRVSNYIAENM